MTDKLSERIKNSSLWSPTGWGEEVAALEASLAQAEAENGRLRELMDEARERMLNQGWAVSVSRGMREFYEKIAALAAKGTGTQPSSEMQEVHPKEFVPIVRGVLAQHQQAYANAHCAEGKNVIESGDEALRVAAGWLWAEFHGRIVIRPKAAPETGKE